MQRAVHALALLANLDGEATKVPSGHPASSRRERNVNPGQLSVAFFLQMFVILAACRASGYLMKRLFDQPQVVGEMIAGVLLGPSVLGLLAPELQAMLFPAETKP